MTTKVNQALTATKQSLYKYPVPYFQHHLSIPTLYMLIISLENLNHNSTDSYHHIASLANTCICIYGPPVDTIYDCFGLNYIPPNPYVEILNSSISECDFTFLKK